MIVIAQVKILFYGFVCIAFKFLVSERDVKHASLDTPSSCHKLSHISDPPPTPRDCMDNPKVDGDDVVCMLLLTWASK